MSFQTTEPRYIIIQWINVNKMDCAIHQIEISLMDGIEIYPPGLVVQKVDSVIQRIKQRTVLILIQWIVLSTF